MQDKNNRETQDVIQKNEVQDEEKKTEDHLELLDSEEFNEDDFNKINYTKYSSGLLCCLSIFILIFHYIIIFLPKDLYNEISNGLLREFVKELTENIYYSFGMEIGAVVIFVIAMRNILVKSEPDFFAQLAQVFTFLTILPWFRWIRWIKEHWKDIWNNIIIYKQYIILILVIAVIFICFLIYKEKIKKFYQQSPFLAGILLGLLMLHVIRFLWYFGGLKGLLSLETGDNITKILDFIVFVICMISFLITCIYYKKSLTEGEHKNGKEFCVWVVICLCFIGIGPVLYNLNEIENLLSNHWEIITVIIFLIIAGSFLFSLNYNDIKDKVKGKLKLLFILTLIFISVALIVYFLSKFIAFADKQEIEKGFYIVIWMMLLLSFLSAFILFLMFGIKLYFDLREKNLTETEFWKRNIGRIESGKRIFLYGYIAAIVLAITIPIIRYFSIIPNYFEESDNLTQSLVQLIVFAMIILIAAIVVIFAICQGAVYLVRTLKEIEDLGDYAVEDEENKRKTYYRVHILSALFTIILSAISWFIFNHMDFTDEDVLGIAGNAFRYFAFPIIVFLWYAILFYLFIAVFSQKGKREKKLYRMIRKNAYDLAESFVYSIFAPFRLFFNFFDVLAKAMLDEEENQDDAIKRCYKVQKSYQIKSSNIKRKLHRKRRKNKQ